jgi:hypothetical protein
MNPLWLPIILLSAEAVASLIGGAIALLKGEDK